MALSRTYHWPELVTWSNLTLRKFGRSPSVLKKERIINYSKHQQFLPEFLSTYSYQKKKKKGIEFMTNLDSF